MTHAAQAFGKEQADRQMGWRLMIFEGLFYITGAFIYAVSSMERRVARVTDD
jgi:adiponectin receptor